SRSFVFRGRHSRGWVSRGHVPRAHRESRGRHWASPRYAASEVEVAGGIVVATRPSPRDRRVLPADIPRVSSTQAARVSSAPKIATEQPSVHARSDLCELHRVGGNPHGKRGYTIM